MRNSASRILIAMAQRLLLPQTMVEIKALAARHADHYAKTQSLLQVLLEGASAIIIEAIRQDKVILALFGNLTQDTKVLTQSFQWSVSHLCVKSGILLLML